MKTFKAPTNGRRRDVFLDKPHPGCAEGNHGGNKKAIYFFSGFTDGFQSGNRRPDRYPAEGRHVGILADFFQNRNGICRTNTYGDLGIIQHVNRVLDDFANISRRDVAFYNLLQSP